MNLIAFLRSNDYEMDYSSDTEIINMALKCQKFQSDVNKPTRPTLAKLPNAEDARKFATEMAEYETAFADWKTGEIVNKNYNMKLDALICAFIKERSGLDALPFSDKVKNNIFSKAWSYGHSSGHVEVYNELRELVEMLTD